MLDPFAREPEPPRGPSDLVNVAMMDAHDRYEAALKAVGPGQAIILRELTTPAVMCGSLVIWRGVVEKLTGETMAQVQAAVVRRACEDLRLVYEALDGRGYGELRASPPGSRDGLVYEVLRWPRIWRAARLASSGSRDGLTRAGALPESSRPAHCGAGRRPGGQARRRGDLEGCRPRLFRAYGLAA